MWVVVVNGYDDPRGRGEGVTIAIQRVRVGCRVYWGVDGGEHATLDCGFGTDGAVPVLVVHAGTMPAGYSAARSVHMYRARCAY